MYIDWMTWGVWTLGFTLLSFWCVETFKEFRDLFARRREKHQ